LDFFRLIKSGIYKLSAALNIAGVSLILVMSALIVTDILSRLMFNVAVQGQYELVEYMMGLVIVFAIGYTQVRNGHVRITTAIDFLPRKMKPWADGFANAVGFVTFGFIAYETFLKAGMDIKSGMTSAVLYIPRYPFMYACAFGFGIFALVFLVQILAPDESQEKEGDLNLVV
jgi:TRAP-type C4-dicarboxylate transport system permease small subunit